MTVFIAHRMANSQEHRRRSVNGPGRNTPRYLMREAIQRAEGGHAGLYCGLGIGFLNSCCCTLPTVVCDNSRKRSV